MRNCLLLLIGLLVASTFSMAQTPVRDVIYLRNGKQIRGKIVRISERTVQYHLPSDPANGASRAVVKNSIWKVVYGSGKTVIINQPVPAPAIAATPAAQTQVAVSKPDSVEAPVVAAAVTPAPSYEVAPPASSSTVTTKPTGSKVSGRINLTIGPEFSYYPDFINKQRAWLNDSTGFGMKQNVGASIRFDYRVLRPLAISITAGYFGWELTRLYTREGISQYSETKRLTQIPVQIGVKLYPGGGFYILPEGGVNLLFASVKTSDTHPTPANESVTSTPLTYGASVGYEIRAKALLLDFSLRYQIMNISNFQYVNFNQTLKEKVNIATIRLGIGFGSSRK